MRSPDKKPNKAFYVEYFLAQRRGGRFLSGPHPTRSAAARAANDLLKKTDPAEEVCRVTILCLTTGQPAEQPVEQHP